MFPTTPKDLDLILVAEVPDVLALYRAETGEIVGWVIALPDGSAHVLGHHEVIRAINLHSVATRWAKITDSVLVHVTTDPDDVE